MDSKSENFKNILTSANEELQEQLNIYNQKGKLSVTTTIWIKVYRGLGHMSPL